VIEALRFLIGQPHYFAGPIREPFIHGGNLPDGINAGIAHQPRTPSELFLWRNRNSQVFANLPDEAWLNFRVPWDGGLATTSRINVNRMPGSFAAECATIAANVLNQLAPLHWTAVV
jgi:hypothetical protein